MIKVITYDKPDGYPIYRLVWSRENGEIILAEMPYEGDLPIYSLMEDLNSFEELLLEHDLDVRSIESFTRRIFTATRLLSRADVVVTLFDPDDEGDMEYLVASNIPLSWAEQVLKIVQFIGMSYKMFDDLLSPDEA